MVEAIQPDAEGVALVDEMPMSLVARTLCLSRWVRTSVHCYK